MSKAVPKATSKAQSTDLSKLPYEERVLSQEHRDEMMTVSVLLFGTSFVFYTSSNKRASLAVMIVRAAINALALSGSNYLFSKLLDHGQEEQKRHDLAMKKFQEAIDEWYKEWLKNIDFIIKRLHDQQHAKQAITDLKHGIRKYYQVFGRKVTS